MSKYKLRPHHGLCISFFEGKGYSSEFTANMTDVIEVLNRENPEIELTLDTDIICGSCPHNNTNICADNEKVCRYDNGVLNLCGLENKSRILWKDFHKTVYDKIISCGKLYEVCGDCKWQYICGKNENSV